jgi:hypothetical protein
MSYVVTAVPSRTAEAESRWRYFFRAAFTPSFTST